MATTTYEPIQTQTLGSNQATVTFSSIPSTYTDLVLVMNYGSNSSDTVVTLQFNGDTASNYSWTSLIGTGSSAASNRNSNQTYMRIVNNIGATSGSILNTSILQIQNYNNSTTYKTVIARNGNAGSPPSPGTEATVGLWRKTPEVINTIALNNFSGGNFLSGSTFTLYGIANPGGDTGLKANGGIITSDATYWYHTFLGSNTFTPKQSLTADILVVAGGGGGGRAIGAGGGAGGVLGFASQSLTTTGYTVTVGAGGIGGTTGTNGSNSQFSSLTASVGGGVGGDGFKSAGNGGSGGGAGYNSTGGTGTSGQGNAGGNGGSASNFGAGGGGGAGSAGSAGTSTIGGNGGNGVNTVTNWGSLSAAVSATAIGYLGYIAGGGGGGTLNGSSLGTGGSGGGGNSGNNNGVTNTGSGGGGAYANDYTGGGNGGSGVVIVRYLKA
jgi:hypothetical protein